MASFTIQSSPTTTTTITTTTKTKTKISRKEKKRSSLMTIQKQQEENVAILANTNKEDSPIYMEINNVMNEIEKFRERLHELSRIQQQQYESLSDDSDNNINSKEEEKQLETNENMMKAIQNQLAIIRQHIGNVLDNCEMLDENLLTVIMTYNEEVNIALQEAFEEIPSLYKHSHHHHHHHHHNLYNNNNYNNYNYNNNNYNYNNNSNNNNNYNYNNNNNNYNYNNNNYNYNNNNNNNNNNNSNSNFCNSLENSLNSPYSYNQHLNNNQNYYDERNDTQQIIETQAIQIFFLEKANFNNIFQLISDIEQCQDLLHNYTKLKGLLKDGNGCRKEFNSELRLMEVKELLIQYECKTQILEGIVGSGGGEVFQQKQQLYHQDWLKQFIGGLLQRLIIETILDHCDIYFNGTFHNSEITTKRESILGLTKFTDFSKPLSKMNPEVYSVLGSKGYDGFDHPFIEFVAEKIVAIMNQYCIIESLEKKDQIKELSLEVVHSIINIFYFRMQAQEQPSQFRWIENGKKIDSETMKGTWDNKHDDLLVDICYFPLIGRKLINEDLLKVYSKAKVYPYRRPESLNLSDNLPVNLPGGWPKLKY